MLKNYFLVLFITVLTLFNNPAVVNGSVDTRIEVEYFLDNKIYTVADLVAKEFFSPLKRGDEEWAVFKKEERFIYKINGFYFGYIKENEEQFFLNSDTVSLLADYNHLDYVKRDTYTINLTNARQEVEGIYLGREVWEDKNYGLSLTIAGKLLNGKNLTNRDYRGEVIIEDNRLKMTGSRMIVFSEMGERITVSASNFYSIGYSIGFNLDWEVNQQATFSLKADNLFSRLYWYDVYTEGGDYNSDNVVINEEGYFEYVSAYKGAYDFKDYVTALTPRYELSLYNNAGQLGIICHQKIYPYLNLKIFTREVYDNDLVIMGGLFGDYYSLGMEYRGIMINLKSKGFSRDATGIGGIISINGSF